LIGIEEGKADKVPLGFGENDDDNDDKSKIGHNIKSTSGIVTNSVQSNQSSPAQRGFTAHPRPTSS
jgi:hypothetical protein